MIELPDGNVGENYKERRLGDVIVVLDSDEEMFWSGHDDKIWEAYAKAELEAVCDVCSIPFSSSNIMR